MKIAKLPVIAYAMLLSSCSMDYEQYASFDVYYPNAFVTQKEAVLGSAAYRDSSLYVSDNEISMEGGFEYADNDIIGYGHCWVKGNYTPYINKDSSNCIIHETFINSGERFHSLITGLEHETSYSIRSFVITRNGSVGYNPTVFKATTSVPHDKWYDCGLLNINGKAIPQRADGVSIVAEEDGDTVTYFGLGRNGSSCYNDFYCYSSKNKAYRQLSNMKVALWGAAGFYLDTEDDKKNKIRRIYVGTGCTRADNYTFDDYTQQFFCYDMATNKWEQVSFFFDGAAMDASINVFAGQVRTGAVAFGIYGYGFVGLGECEMYGEKMYPNDFYTFVMDTDEKGNATPTRGYFKQMTQRFPYDTRSGMSAVAINDIVYLAGGIGAKGKNFCDMYRCAFSAPEGADVSAYEFKWTRLSDTHPFPDGFKGRGYGVAFSIGENFYWGSGEDSQGNLYSDFVKYELSSNRIIKCAPYKNGDPDEDNKEISRAFVINGGDRAFVGGGRISGEEKYVNNNWVYRP